jgi:hypothetical protein
MNELFAVLMSWAVTLSGYPPPAHMPEVVIVPHELLVKAACSGRECKVLGWFPPGQKIFLDERLLPLDDTYSSSVVIHEMVHYLQQESGRWPRPYSCADTIQMEHEAYAAQQEFMVRYGDYRPIGISMHAAGCIPAAAPQ